MDAIDAATKLAKEFGVSQSDAVKAIDAEVDDLRHDPFRSGRKPSYAQAVETAYSSVREWLLTGDDYVINLEWDDICRFTHSHRKACVWAVLTAKANAAKKVAA
jgi:hypothetical protein